MKKIVDNNHQEAISVCRPYIITITLSQVLKNLSNLELWTKNSTAPPTAFIF